MDILENVNEIGNELINNIDTNLENLQNNFLKTNVGKITNLAIDFGLRTLLPDLVEDEVIEVKDALLTGGVNEAIDQSIESAINVGKKALGISDKEFESIEQAKESLKEGNFIEGVSNSLNVVLDNLENTNIIPKSISNLIKDGKNIIIDNVDSSVSNEFQNEIKALQKIQKYTNNWEKYYLNKNLDGMNKEFSKIEKQMKKILPLEKILKNVEKIQNINNLIKNSDDFDFNKIYLELSNKL